MTKSFENLRGEIMKLRTLKEKLKLLVEKQPSNYKICLTDEKYGFTALLDELNRQLPMLNDDVYELKTKIYWILNDIVDFPKCRVCGNPMIGVNVYSVQRGYKDMACCKACRNKLAHEARKKAMISKYGVTNVFQLDGVKARIKKRNIDKYGCACPANNKGIREKIKKENLNKYGVEHYQSTDECKEKTKTTCIERFGVSSPLKSDKVMDKLKATNNEKYGVDFVFQSKDVRKKITDTLVEKYGENYKHEVWGKNGNVGQYRRAYKFILNSSKYIPLFSENDFVSARRKGVNEFAFRCKNCGKTFYSGWDNGKTRKKCPYCEFNGGVSSAENEVLKYVSSIYTGKIETNSRNVISPLELDEYIPEKKLAIEYDGLYWHNDDIKTDYRYHLTKTEMCESHSIQLIHIFESEWLTKREIVKSRIRDLFGIYDKTIYARKCEIREVSSKESTDFQDENHIQGAVHAKKHIGLFFNGELVSLMTFGKCRFDKKHEWEMLRFCCRLGYHVPGAAGKLLKYFESTYSPKSLVSYADRRWSVGKLYKKLGFNFLHNSNPNYWYFNNFESPELYSRVKFQKHKLRDILETFDENLTEIENMKNNGYYRIFDCGNMVFEKIYPENVK